MHQLLNDWRAVSPNDPERYTSEFNYFIFKSRREIIAIQGSGSNTESFSITDSAGKVVGFLTNSVYYDSVYFEKALSVIEEGIKNHPDRLDMRFGKIYALGEAADYSRFTHEVIRTINHSVSNKNKWWWGNTAMEDGEDALLGNVQSYLAQLYNTEDDSLLVNMVEIGELALAHYPKNIEILSTTAVALLLLNNYEKAIDYLKMAEQINPEDYIVLNNIAQAYKLMGDKDNAIKYYELTAQYGDDQAKYESQQNISRLKQ